jgi:putative nucleotidyltransferase with HDIG domain|uniref:HD domain-containing protein n=1 Tax=candidate division WOR-3 bacterium TaxID=2052148 RepID=A0A7V3RII7_UNCW3
MDENYIKRLFPEIGEIKEEKLRKGVINAWLIAIEKGRWQDIENIPFTLLINTRKGLIEHTRAVTKMAMAIARIRDDLNYDIVVAGGLVHDVGKLLEYEYKNGKYIKSAYGKLVRHPVSGYHIVLEAGLPLEIAHIVCAHSEEGEKVNRSPEAILIHHCDFIDFEIEKAKTIL